MHATSGPSTSGFTNSEGLASGLACTVPHTQIGGPELQRAEPHVRSAAAEFPTSGHFRPTRLAARPTQATRPAAG